MATRRIPRECERPRMDLTLSKSEGAVVLEKLNHARVKQQKVLLSGLEADRILSESIPLWVKLVFVGTNLPYWVIAFVAGYDWFLMRVYHESKEDLHVCGHPAVYFIVGLVVALSSTIMHGSQMRLGSCFCCAHPVRSEQFHEPKWQKVFKRVDIFCAISALGACVACRAWSDLAATLAVALPLFVAGIFLKRMSYHYTYLFTHGLWHIVTATLAWDAVLNRTSGA
jgi:hypothetical protein